ncbi:hypothetical protein ES703_37033 [subsurface metagenome]
MRTGSLDELEIQTRDEIGYLTRNFHTMAKKLIHKETVIKKQLEKISFLHQYSDNILKNLQAGVLLVNPGGGTLNGYS